MRASERRQLTDMVGEYKARKARLKQDTAELRDLEANIIDMLSNAGQESFEVKDADGGRMRAKIVGGSHDVLDEERLRKKVGAKVWAKITTRIVDKDKLKAKIADETVNATLVAECSENIPHKPYVKVT